MKIYYCKLCNQRGKEFGGNRQMVRKHLREEHLIKGKVNLKEGKTIGMKTANTIVEEV